MINWEEAVAKPIPPQKCPICLKNMISGAAYLVKNLDGNIHALDIEWYCSSTSGFQHEIKILTRHEL